MSTANNTNSNSQIKDGEGRREQMDTDEPLNATFVATSPHHIDGVALCASITMDTSSMAVAKADFSIHIFALKLHVIGTEADLTKGETFTLSGHRCTVYMGQFSPDGGHLLTCSEDFEMRLWSMQVPSCVSICIQSTGFVRGIAFDASKPSFIATVVETGYACLWKVDEPWVLCKQRIFQEPELTACIFRPLHNHIVSGSASGRIRIWDNTSNKISVTCLLGSDTPITALAISSCSYILVAGTQDGLIFVWNISQGEMVLRFTQHKEAISSIAFAPDNSLFAVGCKDTQMSVWNIEPFTSNLILLLGSRSSECGKILQVRFVSDSQVTAICLEPSDVDTKA
ncbi:probable serine/threonine-protein kinase PkwA [Drosophila subobscura]|uniref:probable serine/threonine-protein kinase PkwA n=1 Tax=Drosophila subobscura TaxID=7241 RepID=UPI00155A4C32|nr:probable serine/threonine-protein kinase PkwA [Drosophila subobscura]